MPQSGNFTYHSWGIEEFSGKCLNMHQKGFADDRNEHFFARE